MQCELEVRQVLKKEAGSSCLRDLDQTGVARDGDWGDVDVSDAKAGTCRPLTRLNVGLNGNESWRVAWQDRFMCGHDGGLTPLICTRQGWHWREEKAAVDGIIGEAVVSNEVGTKDDGRVELFDDDEVENYLSAEELDSNVVLSKGFEWATVDPDQSDVNW